MTHTGAVSTTYLFNVRDYGAVGDGQSDDTTPIQAAIDDAGDAGGGIVYVPPGSYRITGPVSIREQNNTVLAGIGTSNASGVSSTVFVDSEIRDAVVVDGAQGDEQGRSRLKGGTRNNAIVDLVIDRNHEPDDDAAGVRVRRAAHTTLHNLAIYNHGRGVVAGTARDADGRAEQTRVRNCLFTSRYSQFDMYGYPDSAIKLLSSTGTKIHDTFIAPTNVGIDMALDSNRVLISQCNLLHYEADGSYNVRARGTGSERYVVTSVLENAPIAQILIESPSSNFGFIGSWIGSGEGAIELPRRGIDIREGVSAVRISYNRIGHQHREAVRSRGDGVSITDNIMIDNVRSGREDTDSVSIEGGNHVRLTNNRIWSGAQRYGAHLTGDLDDFMVIGNDFTADNPDDLLGGNDGMVVDTAGDNRIVTHNLRPES